jgi:hypothetical protein
MVREVNMLNKTKIIITFIFFGRARVALVSHGPAGQ